MLREGWRQKTERERKKIDLIRSFTWRNNAQIFNFFVMCFFFRRTCWAAARWQWGSSFPDLEAWEIPRGRDFSLHHSPWNPARCFLNIHHIQFPLSAVAARPAPLSRPHDPLLAVPPSPLPLCRHVHAQVSSHPLCPPQHPLPLCGLALERRHLHSFWDKDRHYVQGLIFGGRCILKKLVTGWRRLTRGK